MSTPIEPTLGWLETVYKGKRLAVWQRSGRPGSDALMAERPSPRMAKSVLSFTPATAVPTEALDTLRDGHATGRKCRWVADFLAAVDQAIEETA